MTEQEIIDEVYSWLEGEHDKTIYDFVSQSKQNLIEYHDTLGRSIRNYFKLWEKEWEPVMENQSGIEVDASPDHPDQVSMRIIEAVWKRAQGDY